MRAPATWCSWAWASPCSTAEAVLAAIHCLCTDLGMAQRRITVSTVGVPKTLPTLAELALERLGRAQFTLAVSLHARISSLREELIPTAHAYPIEALLDDCRRYVAITGRRVSFEYILLGGLNDQPRHAEALARLIRGFQSHVNLIPYNPIAEEEFQRPQPGRWRPSGGAAGAAHRRERARQPRPRCRCRLRPAAPAAADQPRTSAGWLLKGGPGPPAAQSPSYCARPDRCRCI
jgi:hypothetical protein